VDSPELSRLRYQKLKPILAKTNIFARLCDQVENLFEVPQPARLAA
jgi:hypothetical protein